MNLGKIRERENPEKNILVEFRIYKPKDPGCKNV